MNPDRVKHLALGDEERTAIYHANLFLMASDIAETAKTDGDAARDKRGRREEILREASRPASHARWGAERQLRAVEKHGSASTPLQKLLLLVELANDDPFLHRKVKLQKATHEEGIRQLAEAFGVEPASAWADAVLAALKDARSAHSNLARNLIIGAGVVAAIALTGGLAAPAIGGLIGAAMGLSGAAAVSAGLAALGGGAVAAGGLGMVGGTVVIAGAFGAVGAGTSVLFLREGGERAALVAAIKVQALFAALLTLDLMDYELGEDLLAAFEMQRDEFRSIAKREWRKAKKKGTWSSWTDRMGLRESDAAKVAKRAEQISATLERSLAWCSKRYSEKVAERGVRRTSVVLHSADAALMSVSGDTPFSELWRRHLESKALLEACIAFVRNANRSFSEVKDAGFFVAVKQFIRGEVRERLYLGTASLQEALGDILALLEQQQAQAATIAQAVASVKQLQDDAERARTVGVGFKELAIKAHAALVDLKGENAALVAKNAALLLRLAESRQTILLANAFLRLRSDDGNDLRLLQGRSGPAAPEGSGTASTGAIWSPAVREELQLARLLASDPAGLKQDWKGLGGGLAPYHATMAEISPDLLGISPESSPEAVERAYKNICSASHPDRVGGKPARAQEAAAKQLATARATYDLYKRYLVIASEGGV